MEKFIEKISNFFKSLFAGSKKTDSTDNGTDSVEGTENYIISGEAESASNVGKKKSIRKVSPVIIVSFIIIGIAIYYFLFMYSGESTKPNAGALSVAKSVSIGKHTGNKKRASNLLMSKNIITPDRADVGKPLSLTKKEVNVTENNKVSPTLHETGSVLKKQGFIAQSKPEETTVPPEPAEKDNGAATVLRESNIVKQKDDLHSPVREESFSDPFNVPEDEQYINAVDMLSKQLTVLRLQAKIAEEQAKIRKAENQTNPKPLQSNVVQRPIAKPAPKKPKKPKKQKIVFRLPKLNGVMINSTYKVAVLSDGRRIGIDAELFPGLRVVDIEKDKLVCQDRTGRYYLVTPNSNEIYIAKLDPEIAQAYVPSTGERTSTPGRSSRGGNQKKSLKRIVLR